MYLSEINGHFDKVIKSFSLRRLLIPIEAESDPDISAIIPNDFQFKFLGKTAKYNEFIENRRKIKQTLVIFFPVVRCVLDYSYRYLPKLLVDLGAYRENARSLGSCENDIQMTIEANVSILKRDWYMKIVTVLLKHFKKSNLNVSKWRRILNCVEGLMNRQLTELKTRTFEHIVKTLEDKSSIPFVAFDLIKSEGHFALCPNNDDIFQLYMKFLEAIANVGLDFISLEAHINHKDLLAKKTYLKVTFSKHNMEEFLNQIKKTLTTTYDPILNSMKEFEKKFAIINNSETKAEFEACVETSEYFEKIEKCSNFSTELSSIVASEYFGYTIIKYTKAINTLKEQIKHYLDDLIRKITEIHWNECLSISNWLSDFEKRALEIPTTTEMLQINDEYMLNVKSHEIFIVISRIQDMLKVFSFNDNTQNN